MINALDATLLVEEYFIKETGIRGGPRYVSKKGSKATLGSFDCMKDLKKGFKTARCTNQKKEGCKAYIIVTQDEKLFGLLGHHRCKEWKVIDITGDSDEDGMIVSTKTKGKPTQSTLNIDNYS